jgi:hypothetical protein
VRYGRFGDGGRRSAGAIGRGQTGLTHPDRPGLVLGDGNLADGAVEQVADLLAATVGECLNSAG